MSTELLSNGTLLLSEPFMLDPNFRRTAVLLCDHDEEEGTVGFVLNRPINHVIGDFVEELVDFEAPVFFGGPVQIDTIHYLHSAGDLLDESIEVCPGVYWSGNFSKLKVLAREGLLKPHQVRFFLGYSGWSGGQLKGEMEYNTWVVSRMDANYLFKIPADDLWQTALAHKGQHYSVIAQMPDNDGLN